MVTDGDAEKEKEKIIITRLKTYWVLKNMNIRPATLQEIPSITEIYNEAVKAGKRNAHTTPVSIEERNKWFEKHSPEKHPVFVAENIDSILGYLAISPYRLGRMALRHTAEVSFYVRFDHHRQGVAARLLQHAMDLCPSLQIKTLFAVLLDCNDSSINY